MADPAAGTRIGPAILIVEAIRHLRRRRPAIKELLEDPPTASATAGEAISEAIGRLWEEAKQPQSQSFLALYFELAALSVREPATYRPPYPHP